MSNLMFMSNETINIYIFNYILFSILLMLRKDGMSREEKKFLSMFRSIYRSSTRPWGEPYQMKMLFVICGY